MTASTHPSGSAWRNFYGRLRGKALSKKQEELLATRLANVSPGPVHWRDNPERLPLDLKKLFGTKDIWLEIGFGAGEYLVHQAKTYPNIGFIGCEPYLNGVAMLLGKIEREALTNIRIYPGDVRHLFDVLPKQSISRAFLLYPDPWPKKRHHKRRFVTPNHINPLAHVMKKGSIFNIATDVKDYVRQTLEEVPQWGFETVDDPLRVMHKSWQDWVSTRYEQKALREGRTPYYITFKRSTETMAKLI